MKRRKPQPKQGRQDMATLWRGPDTTRCRLCGAPSPHTVCRSCYIREKGEK